MNTEETEKKAETPNITRMIIRALKGNKFERMELIKSPHKLVRQAVLLNQKITEDEIQSVTALKTIETDVLVKISEKMEWLKSYKTRYNLVANPKTPVWTAIKLLNNLSKKDIRNISKNRDISHPIRLEATKMSLNT